MGCCINPENKETSKHLPEEAELAHNNTPGTWGVYIPSRSDEEESIEIHPNPSKIDKSDQQQRKKENIKKRKEKQRKRQHETDEDKDEENKKQEMEMMRLKKEEEVRRKKEEELRRKMEEERKRKEEEEKRERLRREEEERKERERREKRANQRKHALKELLDTEQTYVGLLKQCIDVFVDPLMTKPELLQNKIQNAHRILFSDIKLIYGVNQAFLDDLSKKFEQWDNNGTNIGDDLKRFTPYFRSYQSYLNNYENASVLLSRVTKLEKDKYIAFNEWYDAQRLKYCDNKTLDFYLILPIQRLPRYKLCLNEIIKNTETDHPDLEDLNIALQSIMDTTMLCNERMKEFQSRSLVRDIENQFVSYSNVNTHLVTPSRRFVKQGTLWRVTRKGDEHELSFFLFDDLLCYASTTVGVPFTASIRNRSKSNHNQMNNMNDGDAVNCNNNLRLQMRLPIDDIFHVKDVYEPIAMKKYGGRAFEIHSSIKSIIVYASDIKQKTEWLLAITHCVEKIQSSHIYGGKTRYELSSAIWIPDDWSDFCMVNDCKKKFNSITTRRHHCRWCGKLICGTCGKYKLSHKIHKNNMVSPVCKDCYNKHHKRFRANTGASPYNTEDDEEIDENEQDLLSIDENKIINHDDDDDDDEKENDKKKEQFLTVSH